MARRIIHLTLLIVSFLTITAFAFTLMVKVNAYPAYALPGSALRTDQQLHTIFHWTALIGGAICATVVATKTAWSFYSDGRAGRFLNRKIW